MFITGNAQVKRDHFVRMFIPFHELRELLGSKPEYPKYSSQLLNLANRFSQGTRPKIVGQMSELIRQWELEESDHSFESWRKWYLRQRPTALEESTRRVRAMLGKMKNTIDDIDDNTIRRWVEDLVITNTYVGMRLQDLIMRKLASDCGKPFRGSTPAEESKGIDCFIGDVPISVKPSTYKLQETWIEKTRRLHSILFKGGRWSRAGSTG
jgi:hypothetical protein